MGGEKAQTEWNVESLTIALKLTQIPNVQR